jgi:hypothetical protein
LQLKAEQPLLGGPFSSPAPQQLMLTCDIIMMAPMPFRKKEAREDPNKTQHKQT